MKKLLALMMISAAVMLLIAVASQSVFAEPIEPAAETYSGTCGYDLKWTLDTESGVLSISGIGDMDDYHYSEDIPWHLYSEYIKSVNIAEGVTSIGRIALTPCYIPENITIPESVTKISDWAFCNCTSLKNIQIPKNVVSIGNGAFVNCPSVESITVAPGNPKYHSDGNCIIATSDKTLAVGCKNTIIPSDGSVTEIAANAFGGCTFESITIPESINYIEIQAFDNCDSLKRVDISDLSAWCGIYFGGYNANPLYYARNLYLNGELLTDLTIPDDVSVIKRLAFIYCNSLRSVTVPDSVKSIGLGAFYSCSSLERLDLGSGVSKIEGSAFQYCGKLTSVELPDSVSYIGGWAFGSCVSLTSVTLGKGEINFAEEAFYQDYKLIEVVNHSSMKIAAGSISAGGVACYAGIVHDGDKSLIEKIGDYLFLTIDGENYLIGYTGHETSPVLPDDYKGEDYKINEFAFYFCTSLKRVTTGKRATSIGHDAFTGCYSLERVNIGDSVADIEFGAFYLCRALKTITLPDGLSKIESGLFYECKSLKSVVIPKSVEMIDFEAFYECPSLTDVYYCGSQDEWKNIEIGEENSVIFTAAKHFDYDPKHFTDVPFASWFEQAAVWCGYMGYITGTGEGMFSPNAELTRGMFVQILAKIDGVNLDSIAYGGKFADVKSDDWYAKAVQWAVDNGLTGGTGETTFSPDSPVTREQLATFFFAYTKFKGCDTSKSADIAKFTDAVQISDWAADAVKWAVAEGLITGTSETTVSPKMSATRAQAAVIFKNFVENFK